MLQFSEHEVRDFCYRNGQQTPVETMIRELNMYCLEYMTRIHAMKHHLKST
jgi:hypothetical protein